jgi:hypothetical protein
MKLILFLSSKYEKEDSEYNQSIKAISNQQRCVTPRDFEVDIKFWLTEVKMPIFSFLFFILMF